MGDPGADCYLADQKTQRTQQDKIGGSAYPYVAHGAVYERYYALYRGKHDSLYLYVLSHLSDIDPEHDNAILIQMLYAVRHLHLNNFVADNDAFTAENVHFSERGKSVALRDFLPWKSYQISQKQANIMQLGRLFFFVFSGEHLTGGMDILPGDLKRCYEPHLACDLISSMRNGQYDSADDCLKHPFFWSPVKRLDFLAKLCNICENAQVLRTTIERVSMKNKAFGKNWKLRIAHTTNELQHSDSVSAEVTQGVQPYAGTSTFDLLRFIRNCRGSLWIGDPRNSNVRNLFQNEEGIWGFFYVRFPSLVAEMYKVVRQSKVTHLFTEYLQPLAGCMELPA